MQVQHLRATVAFKVAEGELKVSWIAGLRPTKGTNIHIQHIISSFDIFYIFYGSVFIYFSF